MPRVSRRTFLRATASTVALGAFPRALRAQPKTVKIAAIHCVTGPLAEPGQACRLAAQIAVDHVNARFIRRLNSLEPGAYSRLGAAIRHGSAVLETHGGTSRRLMVVLSDGLAYDHGYERAYGAADARRALTEARRRGTGCVCLTVGAGTDLESLRRVFGSTAHATVAHPDQLAGVIGPCVAP